MPALSAAFFQHTTYAKPIGRIGFLAWVAIRIAGAGLVHVKQYFWFMHWHWAILTVVLNSFVLSFLWVEIDS